jgi:hypothetical protein
VSVPPDLTAAARVGDADVAGLLHAESVSAPTIMAAIRAKDALRRFMEFLLVGWPGDHSGEVTEEV